jgi:integrase/recombinase XerD
MYMTAHKLADNTKQVYRKEFADFRKYAAGSDLRNVNRDLITSYLARLYDMGYSDSKINQAINAIKFWNEKVLGKKRQTYFIKRPYRDKIIPNIVTPEKMQALINNTRNMKHRTLLHLVYHHGLRISEVQKLTLMNVRTKCENPHLIIRESKHGKSRIASLNETSLELLRIYYRKERPRNFLFEGEKENEMYSKTSMRRVLGKACKREGIDGRFRFHDLRHNFITHALQAGTSIYHLSQFVGCGVRTIVKTYAHLLPGDIQILLPDVKTESKIIRLKTA